MAKKYVVCKDKEEAIAARQADLLFIQFTNGAWERAKGIGVDWVMEMYGANSSPSLWDDWPRAEDFAVLVDDDDDG